MKFSAGSSVVFSDKAETGQVKRHGEPAMLGRDRFPIWPGTAGACFAINQELHVIAAEMQTSN